MISNFLFHRVNPIRDKLWDPMDVARFEKCIRFISKKYEVRLLEDLVLSDEWNRRDRFATLLFDDGYKDNIEYAADILSHYRCRASFYVVTDCIERNIPPWTFMLDYAFAETRLSGVNLTFDFLPEDLRFSRLTSQHDRIAYVKKLKPALKGLTHDQRLTVLREVFDKFQDVEFPRIMMNWKDLHQLTLEGHYVGSHTATHGVLGTMSNQEEIRSELFTSARAIEKNLGYFPTTIAYPVGSYNQAVIDTGKWGIPLDWRSNSPYSTQQRILFLRFRELNYTMSHGGK